MKPIGPIGMLLRLLFLSSVLMTVSANAQKVDAKSAFNRGTKLFADKQYAEAADAFTQAYNARPTWKLLYNIAQAQAGAKHYGLALETFEKYLSQGGDEISEERQYEILAETRKMREMVGDVKVSGPDGAVVWVDNVQRGVLPMAGAVAVSAGVNHQFVVKQNDQVLLKKPIRVRAGMRETLAVSTGIVSSDSDKVIETEPQPKPQPEAEVDVAVTQPSDSPPPKNKLKTTGLIFMSVGGASIIGGLVVGGMGMAKQGELEDKCDENLQCWDGGQAKLEKSRDSLLLTADILLIAGGATAAVGIVFWAIGKKRSKEQVSLTPSVGPHHAALTIGRTF